MSKKKSQTRPARARKPAPPPAPPSSGVEMLVGELKEFDPFATMIDTSTLKRLRTFAEAHHGADLRVIVNKAVEDFITADLGRNQGVAEEM